MNEEENIQNIIDKEEELSTYDGEDKVISSHEMQKKIDNSPKPEVQISSGIPHFDRLTEGFFGGELITVGGAPGMGKSLLAQTLTCNFIKDDISTLWFSYEMPPRSFLKRFPELPLFYMPNELRDKSIEWIEERVIEAKIKYGIKAVIVDNLHYLVDMARLRNPSLEIGQVVRNLKLLSIRNNLVVFLLCPLKMVKPFQEVGMADIRDSSMINHEADCVCLIWRLKSENEYCNKSIIKIDKHRRNGIIDKKIKLAFAHGLLNEYTKEYEQPTRQFNPSPLGGESQEDMDYS